MATRVKAEVIEKYRKDNKLTVEKFCNKCSISKQTYYRLMRGNLNINALTLIKIYNATGLLCSEILEIDD